MKEIPLTQGKYALVDDEDFEWLSQWKWHYSKRSATLGYARRYFLDKKTKKAKGISMHKVLLSIPKGLMTDHIDGNGLNNCKSNLRICTSAQNHRNRRNNGKGTSKYKGVHWHKNNKRWQVQITVNSKAIHLGNYISELSAARAYDKAALKYHREFAHLNFPANTEIEG